MNKGPKNLMPSAGDQEDDYDNHGKGNWLKDIVVPVKGKHCTQLYDEDRKYILDIARPSEYAKERVEREHNRTLEELLKDYYRYDSLRTDLILEYLDEIVTNHKETSNSMVDLNNVNPIELQR